MGHDKICATVYIRHIRFLGGMRDVLTLGISKWVAVEKG